MCLILETWRYVSPAAEMKAAPSPGPSSGGASNSAASGSSGDDGAAAEKDNSFRQFRRLCAEIAEENSYNGKTNIIQLYLTKGSTGGTYIPAWISNYIHYKVWDDITYISIPKLQRCNRWSLWMDK